jgi:hypothetical protein
VRLIEYLDSSTLPHNEGFVREQAEKDFKSFYLQYDQRRNKNFSEIFSGELNEWFRQI